MASPLKIAYDGPDAERVYASSLVHWKAKLARAKAIPGMIAPASLDVEGVLDRAPRLPVSIPRDAKRLRGYSVWKNTSSIHCYRQTRQEPAESFSLRNDHPIVCTVSPSQGFAHWDGTPHNGVALLTLGWAYVFSASLAERQGLSIQYTATLHDKSPSQSQEVVCLDYATPEERMWWQAVTAPGVGWSIADGQGSPWAVDVGQIGLAIADASDDDGDLAKGLPPPPTARQAVQYLARLCAVYRLGRQCSAALATVLTFPLHSSKYFRQAATISLTQPRLPVHVDTCDASLVECSLPDEFEHLSYYMALSLSPDVLGPSLWSVFWAPDVPCNLAGAWSHAAASVLEPILADTADLELLAKVLSFTRAAPLWLGVAVCGHGRLVDSILSHLTTLHLYSHTIPSMTAAAWTGLPSSFLSVHPSTPVVQGGMVSRAQVWRLRHDFHSMYKDNSFSYLPHHGWPPFGEMRVEDVELEIRGHLACDHQWEYHCWAWVLGKKVMVVETGFTKSRKSTQGTLHCAAPEVGQEQQQQQRCGIPESKLETIRKSSEGVTRAIFWWSNSQVERGFGGTLVDRVPGHGDEEEPRSSKQPSHMNDDVTAFISNWLTGLKMDDLAESNSNISVAS